ncbi:hypothetical protein CSQ88_03100 [Iodobacter sp. BJB302]|uniref:hypothetical protein n=1 Tax=Iodobacter sp. LRB TaxID=3127955 RepID=UPI000C117FE9|nr:hypothetical protein CSQ88_03100 [Iodobacter sp. BJB302]
MGHFNDLKYANNFDLLMAPVKLTNLARRKDQRDKGLLAAGCDGAGLPLSNETLNAVVGPGLGSVDVSFTIAHEMTTPYFGNDVHR